MKNNFIVGSGMVVLLWSQMAFCIPNSQVSLDIAAESVARVALYYEGKPVDGDQIDFPLPINGNSQKFEKTSTFFYVVGNVPQANIVFSDNQFVLPQTIGGDDKIILTGSFIFNQKESDATTPLRIPVINNISQGTIRNGIKIKFISQKTAGFYKKGDYANTFTLTVAPVI
ncbi:hypothetical protein [Intestinirhabdus alba]|jgi:hypothetical protein|uniref:Fimbrial protein n=1 Tax=Intestinirhabdus alba TaxID=2899544 RepID=A0A6L6IHL9_9ENTR|nr:hypothetical protein [Intestinirhabdus alba]MTH45585.1 hypothetical protein [Intestinirhabdus alba]